MTPLLQFPDDDPGSDGAAGHFARGRELYDAKQYARAIGQFQSAMKEPRHKANSLYFIGLCLHARGLYDHALSALQLALEDLSPEDPLLPLVEEASEAVLRDLQGN